MVSRVHPLPKLEIEPSDSQCRICFDTESLQKKLISPCKCTGSIEYVHEDCLKTWISLSNENIQLSICDICKAEFKMEIRLRKTCTLNIQNEECFKFLIFLMGILIISGILVIVLFYLIDGAKNSKLTIDEEAYFGLVISTCLIVISVLSITMIKLIISTCIKSEIISWTILSSPKENIFEETFQVTHQEELLNRPSEFKLLTMRNREVDNYIMQSTDIPHINIELVNIENTSFLPRSFRKSGPYTERLPESRIERVLEYQFTARIEN